MQCAIRRPARAAVGAVRVVGRCPQAFHQKNVQARPVLTLTSQTTNLANLRQRQPKELLQTDVFLEPPPEDLTPMSLTKLASPDIMTNPARVLQVYTQHVENDEADIAVLIRAMVQLGFLFDPNSFFATADKQILTAHPKFRSLAHDLAEQRSEIPDAAAPVLLYSLCCLDYRCPPLLPPLLDAIERNLHSWRTEVVSLALYSVCSLGIGGPTGESAERVVFSLPRGGLSKDYTELGTKLAKELGERASKAAADDALTQVSLHDWSSAAYAMVAAGLQDVELPSGGHVLPVIVERACASIASKEDLDRSGWAQFFLYQTLYCVDVEKPASEEMVKRAMPMWIQERLHHRWLDNIILRAQPQGADNLQRDVDASLRRTRTQALLNCSFGRDWDEQHCWFANFVLEPKIALECDSMLPMGPGKPRPNGFLQLKSRILRKIGYTVVTIHNCFWKRLTEDQKDEQILRMRTSVSYVHNKELDKANRPLRQEPHKYDGMERKVSDWNPIAAPASQ
mmetsp:Transcript_55869/g.133167  ORF Transcript_55869/g.133167 Transcript_55869/m.133167 type:complete len:510 (+) Transcript_55869:72-1601(+)